MLKIPKLPPEIKYILIFFIVTRIVLTITGVYARIFLTEIRGSGFLTGSQNILFSIWGVWDSRWYLSIADNWYTANPAAEKMFAYAFFPLYPGLIKILGWLTNDNFLAGVILSNISLIIAAIFLYKIVCLDYDKNTALKSVKYLFLFPTAFILSGIFTESLYLALAIACFYYAKKENWLLAGTIGLFASMTKAAGVLIILPILYEYLSKKDFKYKMIKKDILYLSLIPAGLFIVVIYDYFLTNILFVFYYARIAGWLQPSNNEASILTTQNLSLPYAHFFTFNEMVIAIFIIIFIVFNKKMQNSYNIFTLTSLLINLMTGAILAMFRYVLVIFPFFILFALLVKNKPYLDRAISLLFIIIQIILMAYWTNGYYFTM